MSRNSSNTLLRNVSSARTANLLVRSASRRYRQTATTVLPNSPFFRHAIHTSARLQAGSGGLTNLFDADDQGARPRIQVSKLNDEGFHLSDGLVIPGGVVFVENRAFLWDVDPVGVDELSGRGKWKEEGWTKERFAIFEMVVPRPEILILGTGKSALPPPPELREYISRLGISLDIMDTRNACSTFNLLAEEGRTVAAALMPLKKVDPRTGDTR
ncbi:hypothetical protein NliqN6_4315 [Naganishia liquefaciens]|uniref:NADH dehydrogenase [ubiquinone] 1 alpha subcomplex assembly factor 3 n=1 Tax=Naganishia liquefaciens TaxID=104408 RepID=A0A8H3TVL5_9TREE|nr:hypothetical protein NliqN6_4315 [Naganishia liquefaciens]